MATLDNYKKQKGSKPRRTAIGPVLHLCETRWCRMPPHESHKQCKNCLNEQRQIEKIMQQIRTVFPKTQAMTNLQIIERLWEFRWQRRKEQ